MGSRIGVAIAALALSCSWGCSSGPSAPDDSTYVKSLSEARAEKDRSFGQDADSPIPPAKRSEILPLRYFPPAPEYSVPAVLKVHPKRDVFEMQTSTGQIRKMERVGVLEFTMEGSAHSLSVFLEEDGRLFIPFADATTGTETYPAGRYLDLQPTATGFYTVDFNHAYNPYCAYSESFDCPFPPLSNRLGVAIRAGEKKPGA
jgi:uncharacterized protein (DUF1684 family)